MSTLNFVFSKLEKFTGNGSLDLCTWLCNFEQCCVMAEKRDCLVKGQILMLRVDGRARAILDQYEEEKATSQTFTDLKKQLEEIFDSPDDRETKMTEFETRTQHVDEMEEEFMTALLQLYCAANTEAKSEDVNSAMRCKFLHRINDTLHVTSSSSAPTHFLIMFLLKPPSNQAMTLWYIFQLQSLAVQVHPPNLHFLLKLLCSPLHQQLH